MIQKRVLIVEDEYLIANEIELLLRDASVAEVVSVATEGAAFKQLQSSKWDGVIVDANLNGAPITGVVELLRHRRIPFLIVTGFSRDNLPAEVKDAPLITKPFVRSKLLTEFLQIMV